jgi:protein phosphatase
MGQGLPKAVTSVVVKRHKGALFRAAIAEMNGWRPNMEDAHLIFMRESWGFFGVFDGHGGDQCSAFVARRIEEELQKGCPEDDAALSSLALRVDAEFLESGTPSGSTGTFIIVKPPEKAGGKYTLRVGNIGDSRVLLGQADGTMVEGAGTDGGLTTDHKPDHPVERARIERTGGTVQDVMGVARVNGDLAVSRAFGDAQHKKTGGPAQAEHPVSAEPELCTLECGASDFLLLVCDGISEGTFPNREVVQLAAEKLRQSPTMDPGTAATAVCREALKQGSKDNLSCMIVLFGGGEELTKETELIPGPFQAADHLGFQKAYTSMAEHAGRNLAEAVEIRYDLVRDKLKAVQDGADVEEVEGETTSTLQAELNEFGDGPADNLALGSPERTAWFSNWLTERCSRDANDDNEEGDSHGGGSMNMTRDQFLGYLHNNPQLLAMAEDRGLFPAGAGSSQQSESSNREVRVASLDELRAAVEEHPKLKWDERLVDVCNQLGSVIQDDESDGTSQVTFKHKRLTAWLPTRMLTDIRAKVLVAPVEELRPAVEAHSALKWDARLQDLCQQEGEVLKVDDADGTSRVRFPAPLGLTAWLPTGCLSAAGKRGEVRVAPLEELRQAVEAHKDLKWDPGMESLGGRTGVITETEDAGGFSQVKFAQPEGGFSHWHLPNSALTEVGSSGAAAADDTETKRQRTE